MQSKSLQSDMALVKARMEELRVSKDFDGASARLKQALKSIQESESSLSDLIQRFSHSLDQYCSIEDAEDIEKTSIMLDEAKTNIEKIQKELSS